MLIFMGPSRQSLKNWSERQDLNLRPLAPKASALPNCATLRRLEWEARILMIRMKYVNRG